MVLDDLPPAAALGAVGRAFVEHLGHAVGERPVDDVAVAGDPADVGGAPVDVGLGLEVEHRPMRVRRPGQVAAGRVQDPLRLAGGPGGVHDVERVLGVEELARVLRGRPADGVVPPDVDVVVPLDVLAGAAYDQHLVDDVRLRARLVHRRFQRRGCPAAVAAVGGDHDPRLAVLEPGGQGVGGEAPEDHRVGCADARARQHRHDGLGDHRHVDRDPVALLDAEVGQGVGGLGDLVLELGVGDVPRVALGLADPVEGDLVTLAGLDVPVHAVVRRVDGAADEPLRERRVVPVEHPVPLLVPAQPFGLLGPEGLGVGVGTCVRLFLEVGVRSQVGRRLEPTVLLEQVGKRPTLIGLFGHDLSPVVVRSVLDTSALATLGLTLQRREGRVPGTGPWTGLKHTTRPPES